MGPHERPTAPVLLPGSRTERVLLLLLLAWALLLRLPPMHIPFMHDEISALLRLYPELRETIRKGVMELDTHPPGVQVFEWFWTRVFGDSERVVKLPFALLSVAALFLLYRVAATWLNPTVALLAVAWMASTQYFVLYGQLARPYAFGLFTTAWMADALTRYSLWRRRSALVAFALAAALSAYAHHFALLQAGLIGMAGLLLITPPQRRAYLIACAVAVVLYLPNLPIFLHQLGQGGLSEWLAPPGRFWLADYLTWFVHYSWALGAMLVVLLFMSIRGARRHTGEQRRWPILLLWGTAPLVIGLFYSLLRAPVLQYSVLLFSFPYLLMLAFSGIPVWKGLRLNGALLSVTLIATTTLAFGRSHYSVLGHSKYEAFARAVRDQRPGDLVLIHAPPRIMEFYAWRWGLRCGENSYVDLRTTPPPQVEAQLLAHTGDAVILGLTAIAPVEWIALVEDSFPYSEFPGFMLEGMMQRFTRRPERTLRIDESYPRFRSTVHYRPWRAMAMPGWDVEQELPVTITPSGDTLLVMTGRMYGLGRAGEVDALIEQDNDILELEVVVRTPDPAGVRLVAELTSGKEGLLYRSDRIEEHVMRADSTYRLGVAVKMSDFERRGRRIMYHGYLWNEGLGELYVERASLRARCGNGRIYGLLGPLK